MESILDNPNLFVSTSPHITQKNNTTQKIMRDVLIALIPAVLASIYFFGYLVIINLVVCAIACVGFELLYNLIDNKMFSKDGIKTSTIWNFSCIVTAVILALNLPTTVFSLSNGVYNDGVFGLAVFNDNKLIVDFDMIIICIIGSLVAIVLTKMIFGGIGKNFANPAMVGRIFLFLCFGLAAVVASPLFGLDAKSGASWLSSDKTTSAGIIGNMFFGYVNSAAVGETSVLAIMLGYIYLSFKKVIDWRMPLMIILTAFIFAFLFDVALDSDLSSYSAARMFNKTLAHVLSGGLVFGAVFMATDYSTNPNTFLGSVIFCVGIGFLTMIIRVFANFPEGMSFAILSMNIFTPLIDKYIVPKPFGFVKTVKVKKDLKEAKVN